MSKNTLVLYGKNSVLERLKADPQSIKKICLEKNFTHSEIEELIRANNIEVERLSDKELAKIKPAKDLQGVTAIVQQFDYVSFKDLLERPKEKQATLIFLDRISDPQNLGVIMRTTACFGGFAVVIPKFEACEITEAVLHVASGGENYVPVSMVTNISTAILAAKERGYWIMGALISEDAEDIHKANLLFPLGLVFGSEGEGIRYGIQKHLDMKVRIPMLGAKLSFNVAMACAIFCYEVSRQKGMKR